MADNNEKDYTMPQAKTINVDIDREMRKSFFCGSFLPDPRDVYVISIRGTWQIQKSYFTALGVSHEIDPSGTKFK